MIKNKEILDLLEKKKQETSCDNCKFCDLNAFHRGGSGIVESGVYFLVQWTLRSVLKIKTFNGGI